jgi:transposase
MRYELSDYEWSVIKPMLPNKPRGVPRVDASALSPPESEGHLDPLHGVQGVASSNLVIPTIRLSNT